MSAEEDRELYRVLVNTEDQYVLWPADREIPYSWQDAGPSGGRAECVKHIWSVWTDMRPLSLRQPLAETGTRFKVMINDDEQRAVWPLDRDASGGWEEEKGAPRGTLAECQEFIREVWTDMRPLSLRWRD